MNALPFTITLEEPLLASSLNGDPNSAVSYPFIPGSLIRGALIAQFSRQHQNDNLAFTARDRFFNGRTRFLNAYPAGDDGRRMLPVPLSWQVEKLDIPPKKIFDLSVAQNQQQELKQPRKVSKTFHHFNGSTVTLFEPARRFNVHTHRENREMGRATATEGGVFRYEALASGQVFKGMILFDDVPITDLLSDGPLYLGGSRSTAYGRVKIEVEEPVENWREIGGTLTAIEDSVSAGTFTLTLLSDLIAQNKMGQYTTTLTPDILTRWLDVPIEKVSIKRVFKADSVVGGFNRRWGLPLLQMPVMQAGSVYVLQTDAPISGDTLRQLEAEGVGKRRVDGFGRIAFNWYGEQFEFMLPPSSSSEDRTLPETPMPVKLEGKLSQDLAKTVRKRLIDRELDIVIAQYVQNLKFVPNKIKPNQIARFRILVRKALTGASLEALKDLRKRLEKMLPTGKKQFEKAIVKEQIEDDDNKDKYKSYPLFKWLSNTLDGSTSFRKTLDVKLAEMPLAHFEGIGQDDNKLFTAQTTLRVIDDALARFGKESQKNE